jgi:hypothetical protein
MARYQVEYQSGGDSASWQDGGIWEIGGREDQDVVAIAARASDAGDDGQLVGTMTYAGEGPIGFRAVRSEGNRYAVENQWGGEDAPWHEGGVWVLGDREEQRATAIEVVASMAWQQLAGTVTYAGEEPIGFRGRRLAAGEEPEAEPAEDPVFATLGSVVQATAIAPDGRSVVAGCLYGKLYRYDLLTGKAIGKPFSGNDGEVYSVGFSPSGDAIVSGGEDRTVRLWSRDGQPLAPPCSGHDGRVFSVGFSPSGDAIVSGGQDGTVRLWSRDGQPLAPPCSGHEGGVYSVGFSPSGDAIVSGGDDGTVRLWSRDGQSLAPPCSGHDGWVYSVGFSPSGDAIVSGGKDGTVRLWLNLPVWGAAWVYKPVAYLSLQNQRQIPQGVRGDRAVGNDSLGIRDEIEALAEVLMLRSVEPPLAIGLLGSWGSGKSFGMHLIQQQINAIRAQKIDNDVQAWGDPFKPEVAAPYVGHIYCITFNAWTYAKDDLWASLMQEIFYELNRQIGLERRLVELFANPEKSDKKNVDRKKQIAPTNASEQRAIDRLIYQPLDRLRAWFQAQILRPIQHFMLKVGRVGDLAIVQPIWHVVGFFSFCVISLSRYVASLLIKRENIRESLEKYLSTQSPYYWLDEIPSGKKELNRLEIVIERVLYLLIFGFPKRLKDTQTHWSDKINEFLDPDRPKQPQNRASSTPGQRTTPQETAIFRESNPFWSILYELDPAKRTQKIRAELDKRGKPFTQFDEKTGYRDLWQTLDELQHDEQQKLQDIKQQRDEAEIQLQKLLRTESDRRKRIALFKPIVQVLATAAKLDPEKIDQLSATGNIGKLLRQAIGNTIKTPLGFLAIVLFVAATLLSQQTDAIATLVTTLSDALTDAWTWIDQHPVVRLLRDLGLASFAIALFPKLTGYINAVKEERSAITLDPDKLFDNTSRQAQAGQELNAKLATLRLELKEQQDRAGFTANHSSLVDFVNARLTADTYGKNLGLMQQVRRDLEDLSQRFTPNDTNRERLKDIFPRGPARVVLYIDDLDRCPPDRVVAVLEAVQLLLKTPLFIVVLAIDDRYIARALEQVYQGVLKRRGKPSGIDYLEKIIQIPYRMRSISPRAVEDYLRSQTKVTPPKVTSELESRPRPNSNFTVSPPAPLTSKPKSSAIDSDTIDRSNHPDPEQPIDKATLDKMPEAIIEPVAELPTPTKNSDALETITETIELDPSQSIAPEPQTPPTPQPILNALETITQTIKLDAIEFQILVDSCKHVDITPRTAKRLINIYKILQIIWQTRKQNDSSNRPLTHQDKRTVMSFLALSGRYPEFMRSLFEEIDVLLEEENEQYVDCTDKDNPRLAIELNELLDKQLHDVYNRDSYAAREWRRFHSDIHRMIRPKSNDPKSSDPKSIELSIDRQTFELMLSFCFVGDIGYDPTDYEPTDYDPTPTPRSTDPTD